MSDRSCRATPANRSAAGGRAAFRNGDPGASGVETRRVLLLVGLSLVLLGLIGWPAVVDKVYTARDIGRALYLYAAACVVNAAVVAAIALAGLGMT